MIPVPKSQEPSESLGFQFTQIDIQTVPVRIGLLFTRMLSVPSIWYSKGPVFGPAKMQVHFWNRSSPILDRYCVNTLTGSFLFQQRNLGLGG